MLTGGKPLRAFENKLRATLAGAQTILDIGTSQRFAKELRAYERWFHDKNYIAAGYEPALEYGVYSCDCHQDIENLTYPENSFDAVISIEVLEHTRDPFRAAAEIKRVLRPSGSLLLTTPFLTSYHGKSGAAQSHSAYPDLWRFTHEGLLHLFKDFAHKEVIPLGGPMESGLVALHAARLLRSSLIRKGLDCIDRPKLGRATVRHLFWGVK